MFGALRMAIVLDKRGFRSLACWGPGSMQSRGFTPTVVENAILNANSQVEVKMVTMRIEGHSGRKVVVAVHGYERDDADNPDDANWVRSSVTAEMGSFGGAVEAAFCTHDFARFLAALKEVVAGTGPMASFRTHEEALEVDVQVERTGQATVTGTLRQTDQGTTSLAFSFSSDVTYLTHTVRDLQQVVESFPVRMV